MFERALAAWIIQVDAATDSPVHGWQKVDLVLTAGFRFFMDNPQFVRIVRREALDGGRRLGVDLGVALRPLFDKAVEYWKRALAVNPNMAGVDMNLRAAEALLAQKRQRSI